MSRHLNWRYIMSCLTYNLKFYVVLVIFRYFTMIQIWSVFNKNHLKIHQNH